MLRTTVGQLMLNESLPAEMQNYNRKWDKKTTKEVFQQLAEKHPEKYREVAKRLMDISRDAVYSMGGFSFGLDDLEPTPSVLQSRARLRRRIKDIMRNSQWSDEEQQSKIIEATANEKDLLESEILKETTAAGNPLAASVKSGARGNPSQLKRLIGGDSLYIDHRDDVIPVAAMRSFSEGVSPAEWFAASYGARKGLVDTKFATQDAGFFGKQLNQLAHRLVITQEDDDDTSQDVTRGLPVDTDDTDNEGALLAKAIRGYSRNTVLTPKILQDLRQNGVKRILVRSPAVGGPSAGGVSARDVGYRERGGFSPLGDSVGLAAAQALSEKLTQGQLASKHNSGMQSGSSKKLTGFEALNQMIQAPKTYKGGAAHAQRDGRIGAITKAATGGHHIRIGDKDHFVAPGFDVKVKIGDVVEAGDMLSDGLPNPAEVVRHKGIGEGRRYFTQAFTNAYRDGGMAAHRRNVELISRGLIDHVEMLEETDVNIPGDVVSYSQLEKNWKPRDGYSTVKPKTALGQYLEKPVLHYSVGTKIKNSMLKDFDDFGVSQLDVHKEPPPFQPLMVRAMSSSQHDPDWMTRFLGSNQKKSLLSAAQRGGVSDTQSTSFLPSLVEGLNFGKTWTGGPIKLRK